ncbi:hypothetical protein [Haloplanus halophilus]|uniref:hypothetical protein n=1 Tax=Haloplanus halophilus TaxID=2949993 RepID=UPI00203AD7DD|nr:hypothetical protein [Haloplanus sp. GDY1]
MSRAVPDGWLKTGRREYENRTVEVEVKFQPTPDRSGDFEVWIVDEEAGESTAVDNVQPTEADVRELAKDVMDAFTAGYEAAVDDGADEDAAIERGIDRALDENRA